MSKYYQPDKPFSIDNWNTLIKDINAILTHPPPGTGCQPLEPLQEVTAPHLWRMDDVKEVRDKLKETCPEIAFEAELVLWRQKIIDEIEEEMGKAWCDCISGDEIDEHMVQVYSWTLILASPYNTPVSSETGTRCCGTTITSSPCGICKGLHCHEAIYTGDYYPHWGDENAAYFNQMCSHYTKAYNATYNWILSINRMLQYRKDIQRWQDAVDRNVARVDELIREYTAKCLATEPAPDCPQLCSQIQYYGENANDVQRKVDESYGKFMAEYAKLDGYLAEADAAAEENWTAAVSLMPRFPCDVNLIQAHWWEEVQDVAWGKWFDPRKDDKVADPMSYQLGMRTPLENRAYVQAFVRNEPLSGSNASTLGEIRVTPNGLPFMSGQHGKLNQRVYAMPFYKVQHRWRCESLVGWGCEPEPGNCQFPEFDPVEPIYWSQKNYLASNCAGGCTSFCAWLYAPLPPHDPQSKGAESIYLHIERPAGKRGKDYTQEQREEWEKYAKWYEEHPKYDNRHEKYC